MIERVVASFHEDVGFECFDQGDGRGVVEEDDGVDACEAGQEAGAVVFTDDGSGRSLEAADRGIRVEADDEEVAQSFSAFQTGEVSGVEDVEASVGEDDSAASSSRFGQVEGGVLGPEDLGGKPSPGGL